MVTSCYSISSFNPGSSGKPWIYILSQNLSRCAATCTLKGTFGDIGISSALYPCHGLPEFADNARSFSCSDAKRMWYPIAAKRASISLSVKISNWLSSPPKKQPSVFTGFECYYICISLPCNNGGFPHEISTPQRLAGAEE